MWEFWCIIWDWFWSIIIIGCVLLCIAIFLILGYSIYYTLTTHCVESKYGPYDKVVIIGKVPVTFHEIGWRCVRREKNK